MNICVFRNERRAVSETFIDAHLDRLPGHVTGVYGYELPGRKDDGNRCLTAYLPAALRPLYRVRHRVPQATAADLPARAFRRFLKVEQIDVVLAEYGTNAAMLAGPCHAVGVPLVAHFHGFDAYRTEVLRRHESYAALFRSAAAVVAVSGAMKRQLELIGCPASLLHVIPCGVDPDNFEGGKPAAVPPHFLAVGRFVEKKGPALTLLAFRKVLDREPAARLTMVGDGPLHESCRQIAAALRIDPFVTFTGSLAPTDVVALMQRSRAFVQHSVTAPSGDSEGTPVAVLEAGACGLPVVATNHAGIPEVVINGKTGLLVEEMDIEGMALHMIAVAQNPSLAQQLGEAARQRIRGGFTLSHSIEKLSGVLRLAMLPPGKRSAA